MALTTRQNNIYASEDWKVLYQSFIDADFESYDFQTLRKSMIDYIKVHYPEDFNDYIESSEFIALIDLIAYVAQNISYRVDLNARENFLATAERRESILRLARLVSYNAKRNVNASGLLKLTAISTTEDVYDSNGENLANRRIEWNDINNSNFVEHVNLILNAAMVQTQRIGNPSSSAVLNGILHEEYQINIPTGIIPIFPFQSRVDGVNIDFEMVSATFSNADYVYEAPPTNFSPFSLLYRTDGKGNDSVNTGFFTYFKQGVLRTADFSVPEAIPNRQVLINTSNVSNNDVWLYQLDSNNDLYKLWTQVPAVTGNNVIFNSLAKNVRTLYSVQTRESDQISYVFGDGIFADMPRGSFRAYYRQGNGLSYNISTDDMQGVVISIAYLNKYNIQHTLTLVLDLKQQIYNAAERETIEDIRTKAPQAYYTQNRMVNGEDYNIFPVTATNEIVKAKAVNRTSSGISRYLDVVDPSAKYSSTNVFCEDGILFKELFENKFDFEFVNEMDILRIIRDRIEPILRNVSSTQYYYEKYARITTPTTFWEQSTTNTNISTGYFKLENNFPAAIGTASSISNNRKYITTNSLVKFGAPDGKYFKSDGSLHTGAVGAPGTFSSIWAMVKNVVGDGTNEGLGNLSDGTGPVTLTEKIGDGAVVLEVIPQFDTDLTTSIESTMLNKIFAHEEFGLRFDPTSRDWEIISAENLSITKDFSFDFAGDTSGLREDSSWLIRLKSNGEVYTTFYRGLNYSFESDLETRFYFDNSVKIFDSRTGKTVIDHINIFKMNSKPDSNEAMEEDYIWQITGLDTEYSGNTNTRRVLVTFLDSDDDGIPDNPDQFTSVVAPSINPNNKLVFFEKFVEEDGSQQFRLTKRTINLDYAEETDLPDDTAIFTDKEVLYLTTDKVFRVFNSSDSTFTVSDNFRAYIGRKDLYFNYKHNSPSDRRINPGLSNIIDLYVLTQTYNNQFMRYIKDNTGVVLKPETSTTSELATQFSSLLDYKMLSDEVIFHPVKYKVLFGSKADLNLQAQFKIVKNSSSSITDSEIKTRTVKAINLYFAADNWDFGDTFYFTELAAFIHNELMPHVATVLVVPKGTNQNFGSLFEVECSSDEIFISDAKVENIDIIDAVTASNIRASGTIITSA